MASKFYGKERDLISAKHPRLNAALARRACDLIEVEVEPPPGLMKIVRQHMESFHNQFFAHRTGPGEPLGVV